MGVEVQAVLPRGMEIDTEALELWRSGDLAAAIDARTRIVTAASVAFTPGFRTDVAKVVAAARGTVGAQP